MLRTMVDGEGSRDFMEDARTGAELARYADVAMYPAEPMPEAGAVRAYLLWATPDPLGAISAACSMYEGRVIRSLGEVSDGDRKRHFAQIQKTKLKAPFEFVKFHFLLEGVSRSLTHQMVRQRTAVYAQESLRFAVKEGFGSGAGVGVPPSIAGLPEDDPRRVVWEGTLDTIGDAYEALIGGGVPAEDARELLPGATLTRIHYCTDLRALQDHAGNRLCTQAQFHWRELWAQMIAAIRGYGRGRAGEPVGRRSWRADTWQWDEIAGLFKPVCYLTGKCEFKAAFDRHCSIRERVNAFEAAGVGSADWGDPSRVGSTIGPIYPAEWLLDSGAARR